MQEEIDTNGSFAGKEIPDGKYTFRIMNAKRNGVLYIFSLSYDGNEGEQIFFGNQMGPLLSALKCKESEKGKFVVDLSMQAGKKFSATVYRETSKKDNKIYQRMKDFVKVDEESDVPF